MSTDPAPRRAGLLLALLAAAPLASAQAPDAAHPPATDTAPPPPGLWRVGPVFLTPRLRIGTIGLDTNVFYTASDRRTDFTASGGPGLDIVLPVRSSLRLTVGGGFDYMYFLRTQSQRRFAGDGLARAEWIGGRATAGLEGSYRRMFGRPNFEVDRRVAQSQEQARAEVRLPVGTRLELRMEGVATRLDIDEGQDFFGADLRRSLSRDTYLGRLTTAWRLTAKTSFLLEADHQADRFLLEPARDADSNRLGAGFEIRSATRLAGRAVAGARSFRLRDATRAPHADEAVEPYAAVELAYQFGPRTRLTATYARDLHYSAFIPLVGRPTLRMEAYRLRLDKGLAGALDLRLFGGLTRLTGDGRIEIAGEPRETVTAVRDDQAWEGGLDLGYTFRRHLRIGAAGSYIERRSNIADFGIDGLLLGGTITFTP